MKTRWLIVLIITAAGVGANIASAQDYPNRTIRIVTGSAGSNVDISSRLIAQAIAGPLAQPVIVDNRAGALVGAELVAKAPADGYTLFLTGGSFWIGPLMRTNTPYDALKDFAPVTTVSSAAALLVVHPSVPVKSTQELIAFAKARPGQLNYGGGGTGGIIHLAAELFKAMAGVNVVRVSYSADAGQMADLLSGQVQLTFGNTAVMPHVKAGKLRALAVTSALPSALYPGIPTIAASGIPGYHAVAATALFAAARTPAAIVTRLNQEVARYLETAVAKERFLSSGGEAQGSSPEQLASIMKSEIATLGKVIKDAGIKAD